MKQYRIIHWFSRKISTKIILPYFLLTLVIASIGAFVVTNLVTGSLRERFINQLLDAGRVTAESMVDAEERRLEVLRAVTNTTGIAEAIVDEEAEELSRLVPPIILNSGFDAVNIVDADGIELFGWHRLPGQEEGEERAGANFSEIEAVRLVLEGYDDGLGVKRTFVAETLAGPVVFTLGPIYQGTEIVGAAMVGVEIDKLVTNLAEDAIARVTLYDQSGQVVATVFTGDPAETEEALREPPDQYETILSRLENSVDSPHVIATQADSEVPIREVEIREQTYQLAFGDWRMRRQSFGLYSVALPSNFIVTTSATSRNFLSLFFSLATVAVFSIGYFTAQRIVDPLMRLRDISTAVAQGNLEQRTGIERDDEIGDLAASFDTMTERLAAKNRQLVREASRLEAILHSINDIVIVVNTFNRIIVANPPARRLLETVRLSSGNQKGNRSLNLQQFTIEEQEQTSLTPHAKRYEIDDRIFSGVSSPVQTPDGEQLGAVLVLRDVTREVKAEKLKDDLISSVSHELRTPLTAVKGYLDLLVMMGKDSLSEQQLNLLQKVNNNTDKLINHVTKLIELSELQKGALKLNREKEDFAQLATATAVSWRDQMAQKGIDFQIGMCDDPIWIHGDSRRLSWAIDNLLSNAYHYTSPEGEIEVRVYKQDGEARLEVTDSGIGIASADQPHLFTRFFRANHEQNFNVEGLGLGLFIVKSLVTLHDGSISVDSQLGKGSTFGLNIPLLNGEPADE